MKESKSILKREAVQKGELMPQDMRYEATVLYSPPDKKWFAVINDLDGIKPVKVTDLEEDMPVLFAKLKEEYPDGIIIKEAI